MKGITTPPPPEAPVTGEAYQLKCDYCVRPDGTRIEKGPYPCPMCGDTGTRALTREEVHAAWKIIYPLVARMMAGAYATDSGYGHAAIDTHYRHLGTSAGEGEK